MTAGDTGSAHVAALGDPIAVPTRELSLAADNPRRIPEAAIDSVCASLREFGWQQPIVVNEEYQVLAGHTRLQAARRLKLQSVPVVIAAGMTEEQQRAFRIADNRTHDYSSWDFPLLVEQLDELAPDFADVLGLADWQALVDDLEAGQDAPPELDAAADADEEGDGDDRPAPSRRDREDDETDLDVPDALRETFNGFELVVCFRNKEQATAAGPHILDLPGAYDVRYKH